MGRVSQGFSEAVNPSEAAPKPEEPEEFFSFARGQVDV